MHFEFFSPVKDQSDSDAKSPPSAQSSEREPEGVEIFGKSYSFRGTDKPILCTLRTEPLKKKENTHFSLSYIEADESMQAIRLSVEMQESGMVFLGLSAIKDVKLANFFQKLTQQAQKNSISLQIKSTDSTYLYYLRGRSEDIKKLFSLLGDLMENRFCNYGKDYILTPLFSLFESLYTTVEQNFTIQQQTKAAKNSSGTSISHTSS